MLRRLVNTTQIYLHQYATDHNHQLNLAKSSGNILPSQPQSPAGFSQSQSQRNSQQVYKTYVMNPIIHPASAIPPVANRVVVASNSCPLRGSPNQDQHHHHHNHFDHQPVELKHANCNHRQNHPSTLLTSPPSSRNQAQVSPRWSTGPSLPAAAPITVFDRDLEEGPDRRRRNRINLIELLTCFCPCFSMC